jgi:eukaryotic-like serine/threonine-protein kinase
MAKGPMLESWKEIAAHLRRNVRTCQLWERNHGLPVHRLDGSPKARVFAYPAELDQWLHDKLHGLDRDTRPNGKKGASTLPTLPAWNIGLIAGLAVLAIAAVGTSAWLIHRQAKVRWATDVAIPEIERLSQTPDAGAGFDLLVKVEKVVPDAPQVASLRPLVASAVAFVTDPPGADIWVKDYAAPDPAWQLVGRSPVAKTWVSQGYKRWRAEKDGFVQVEGAFHARAGYEREIAVTMDRPGDIPPGMVRVRGGRHRTETPGVIHLPAVDLKDYFLDKFEVTNRQFKLFVDAGGYAEERFWKNAFVKDGRTISRAEAMAAFVDRTGKPGPATWSLGSYPEGAADLPVSGVSWYEAAAYAEFAGKRLPSFYHWEYAAGNYHEDSGYVVPAGNFDGKGPAAAGRYKGVSPLGVYDMAGNVKEWGWNDVGGGKRLIRGGAWNETQHMFSNPDNYPPLMRAENFGLRCMKEIPGNEGPDLAFEPFQILTLPDFPRLEPCSDEIFEVFRRLFDYTKSDLAPKLESVLQWSEDTTVEKVTLEDAYGEERIPVYLFLPRHGRPPFQTIVYYPGDSAWSLSSVFEYGTVKSREVELFTRSGRAFVFPVYRNSLERRLTTVPTITPQRSRDALIRYYRDLARCLDYLETRPDIDRDRIAYQGLSGGGSRGVFFAALEPRFKAAILMSGGLFAIDYHRDRYTPERDIVNYAPRVRIPVLMQNGKYDYLLPWKTAIEPLFELLGTPAIDKRLIAYESGHSVWFLGQYRKDIFDFLDEHLGRTNR